MQMRRKRNYAMMKLNVAKTVVLANVRIVLILSCVELIGKELHQEVVDQGKEVAEYLILLKKSPKTH